MRFLKKSKEGTYSPFYRKTAQTVRSIRFNFESGGQYFILVKPSHCPPLSQII
jgi:hypothetical protein